MTNFQRAFSEMFRLAEEIEEALAVRKVYYDDAEGWYLETDDRVPISIEYPQPHNFIQYGFFNIHDRETVWEDVPLEELKQTLKNIRLSRLEYDEPDSD